MIIIEWHTLGVILIDFNRHDCFKSSTHKLTALRGMMKQDPQPQKFSSIFSEEYSKQSHSKDIRSISHDLAIATADISNPFVEFQT